MQEKQLDQMASLSLGDNVNTEHLDKFLNAFERSQQIAHDNAEAKATGKISKEARDPTPEELKAISDFMADYKKKNPKASPRHLKRAVKRKFNIVTY